MGYTTKFLGSLKFTGELTATQLAHLKKMLNEDCRDHPEWGATDLYYIDLELADDFSGLRWSGAEKTYSMEKLVNVVIREMRKRWPEFGLSGELEAQGEDHDDRWRLVIGADGMAAKVKHPRLGQKVECPYCERTFTLEAKG
jgi:hypothetical protein